MFRSSSATRLSAVGLWVRLPLVLIAFGAVLSVGVADWDPPVPLPREKTQKMSRDSSNKVCLGGPFPVCPRKILHKSPTRDAVTNLHI
jgi:hypothetical protein